MGALHDGHKSLIRKAIGDNKTVAVSIFVNPKQFAPTEDFERYPRDMKVDLDILAKEKVDLVFAPSESEIYPCGFDTKVDVGVIATRLEGAHRPDHFRGVATVVAKLFLICRPDRAYFGQKDAQQCAVIRQLNNDLNIGVQIIIVPTVRDPDGLAISSRNIYLSSEERLEALLISRSLSEAHALWKSGETGAHALRSKILEVLKESPVIIPEYVSLAHPDTIEEQNIAQEGSLLSLAAYVGSTRLIDNVLLSWST